jgi:hypothetical protein
LRTLLTVHDWETAIGDASRNRGWHLFNGQVDHGDNTSLQNALDIANVRRISKPELLGNDFSHSRQRLDK